MTGSRWHGAKALLGLCAGVAIAVGIAAGGCGDDVPLDHQTGGSKGPEIQASTKSGQPRSPSATQSSQSNPPPPNMGAKMMGGGAFTGAGGATGAAPQVSAACAEGGVCSGLGGCVGTCDPATMMMTTCATCDHTAFTGCAQMACPR